MNDTKKLINDGGPAFSCASSMIVNGKQATVPAQGMSLRDYFAGQALSGWLSTFSYAPPERKRIGVFCYQMADAMLAARNEDAT